MEEQMTYSGHKHAHVKDCTQNFNNKVFATWDNKMLHLWSMVDGAKLAVIKMVEITKTHCGISAVAYSHKRRVSGHLHILNIY